MTTVAFATAHMLIVDDDLIASTTLSDAISKMGCQVSTAPDGKTMWAVLAKGGVDLILLNVKLPDEDGLSLLRQIRRQLEVSVIMMADARDDADRIVAFEMGADDYLTKPLNFRELLARANNILLRTISMRGGLKDELLRRFAGWTISPLRRRLTSPTGEEVRLTKYEFDVLTTLCKCPRRVMSRDEIFYSVTGKARAPSDRTIDVVIGRLRRKIEVIPDRARIIVSVKGVGYVLAD